MLAQNFKTPAELGISDAQFDALVKTLGVLERGETVWVYADDNSEYSEAKAVFEGKFNMGVWASAFEGCGTVCCIGGTAELLGNVKFTYDMNRALEDLFYIYRLPRVVLEAITVEQAAQALRNYLTTGHAKWNEVLNV